MKNKTDIIWLKETDSTNNEAKRRIAHLDNLSVLSSMSQTSGRGQQGNSWSSEAGKNLLFSIVMKHGRGLVKACSQFGFSQVAALAVVNTLKDKGISAMIKWPNDIYVEDRKICGILIENSLREEWTISSIIGIGLNVNQTEFDITLPNPVSMSLITGETYDLHEILGQLLESFESLWDTYLNKPEGSADINHMYHQKMWRKDVAAEYVDCISGRRFNAVIKGVDDKGRLLIHDQQEDKVKEFNFKEISFVL